MLKKTGLLLPLLLCALFTSAAQAQLTSTGLLLNEDSVQLHHIREPSYIEWLDTDMRPSYNFLYSQEVAPRSFLLAAELELPDYKWEPWENHIFTPRAEVIAAKFMNRYLGAASVGASYRLILNEEHTLSLRTDFSMAPPITTVGDGKWLWQFRTQLNYPFTDDVEFNLGYRAVEIGLINNFVDGFERGLYFGITTYFH